MSCSESESVSGFKIQLKRNGTLIPGFEMWHRHVKGQPIMITLTRDMVLELHKNDVLTVEVTMSPGADRYSIPAQGAVLSIQQLRHV